MVTSGLGSAPIILVVRLSSLFNDDKDGNLCLHYFPMFDRVNFVISYVGNFNSSLFSNCLFWFKLALLTDLFIFAPSKKTDSCKRKSLSLILVPNTRN